jgi:hypothetical protein
MRGGAVVGRVDTPVVPRSLGGGGCGATAVAPRVGIGGSTPEAGVCGAGSGLCVCGPEFCGSVRAKCNFKILTGSSIQLVDVVTVKTGYS